jgi:FtsZ-binding cell division protein ZapB
MADNLDLLEKKIKRAIDLIDKLTADNKSLGEANEALNERVADLQVRLAELESREKEISEAARARIEGILERLTVLEQI